MNDDIEEINFSKFKIDEIDLNAKICIIGRPGCGKTSIIKHIIYMHRDRFSKALLMSGTTESSNDFSGIIPDIFVHGGYNAALLDNFWEKQKRLVRKRGKGFPGNQCLIMLDDLMHDTSWVNSKTIADIFMNGRHYDTLFIVAMQYCMGIKPALRACLDYIFICREPNQNNKRKLLEHYCGVFPDVKTFSRVLDALTVDYQCIVVKQRKNLSPRIEDGIFWWKAKLHKGDFKIGSLAMWEFHQKEYNPRYQEMEFENKDSSNPRRKVINKQNKSKKGTLVINIQD
jgi:energy-coupling factor transporter ATP-binding protein EcfA2